jgi:hypothetical protein
MLQNIDSLSVYQNRYEVIKENTSGGFIHGFVGNLVNIECLKNLKTFPLPIYAYHVDDQWMSIYYFLNNISIKPSGIENYHDIFKSLCNNHELIGVDSLFSLGTRNDSIKCLEDYFQVRFLGGECLKTIVLKNNSA